MKTYPLHSISLEQAKQLQFKVIDAVIPPKMVATVLRAPWLMACDTQSKAEGPGDKITGVLTGSQDKPLAFS